MIHHSRQKNEYDMLRRSAARQYKVHRIYDKGAKNLNDTLVRKLPRMLDGEVSPWEEFDIRDASVILWSSGVWDVAYKQDLVEYEERLRYLLTLLKEKNMTVIVRTIPNFKLRPTPRGKPGFYYGWAKTVSLVPKYNVINRRVANDLGISLLDVEKITRPDEVYDGIHFAKSQFKGTCKSRLTGEINRAVAQLYLNSMLQLK